MRTLSARVQVNKETFEPFLRLTLDGVDTLAQMPLEPLADVKALHGEMGEQAMIDSVLQLLDVYEQLTEEEESHYSKNFRTLIKVTTGK